MRHLQVQIGNTVVLVDFHVMDIQIDWNYFLLLGRTFMATVRAFCNMQTNQVCLILVDQNVYDDPMRVVKEHTPHTEIGDGPGFVAVCFLDSGAEHEEDGKVSINTQPEALIDTLVSSDYRESFAIEAATLPRRNKKYPCSATK